MDVNLIKEKYLAGEPLNSADLQAERTVCLVHPCGGETVRLHVHHMHLFLQDPDGFAAQHFGLTKEEYRDWIFHEGHALCAAQTKAGKLFRNFVTQHGSDPAVWKSAHRSEYCGSHRHLG